MDGYLLGILWGCCSIHHDHLICRHKDRYYPDYLADKFGGHVYMRQARTGSQYVVNLPVHYDILFPYGWTFRNDELRPYPQTDDNIGFCTAWFELHHSVDLRRWKNGTEYLRLRIYGNFALMETLEEKISEITGVGRKSICQLHNGKTSVIYYQSSREISRICNVLIRNPRVENEIDTMLSREKIKCGP